MNILKQSTAVTIKLGPLVDDADGKTAETALTISQADIRLSKNGGDFAQSNNAAGATHDENGYYDIPLDTTDTNTLGRLLVAVSESGALPVWKEFIVLPANVYDSLVGGTDKLDVNAAELGGTTQTGNDVGADVNSILEDTGTTLPVEIDAVEDDVWTHSERTLTQSAASVASAVAGSTITAMRGDTLSAALTDLGSLMYFDKIWFTVKSDHSQPDSESLIQIELSDGLKYINGEAATVPANGSITINDEPTGDITVVLDEVETAKLPPGSYYYDIQILRSTGIAISTLSSGTFIVSADYTRATS